jgi:hypothetical protein
MRSSHNNIGFDLLSYPRFSEKLQRPIFHIGILKLAAVWQRRQSLNAKSPPKERLPLWQVRQDMPRAEAKCSNAAGELTCRVCGAPAVSRWQSAQANL